MLSGQGGWYDWRGWVQRREQGEMNTANARGYWRCVLLAGIVATVFAALWPFGYVRSAGAYWLALRAAVTALPDLQIVGHLAVWFAIGLAGRWAGFQGLRFVLAAGAGAAALELTQVGVLTRHASVWDFCFAVAAVAAGHAWASRRAGVQPDAPSVPSQWARLATLLVAVCLSVASLGLMLWGQLGTNFRNWDGQMPLLVGNEATGNRAWRGDVQLLAIFSHSLSPAMVARLAHDREGALLEKGTRQGLGAVVLYDFMKSDGGSVINEVRGPEIPVGDLVAVPPSAAALTAQAGLRLTGQGVLQSTSPLSQQDAGPGSLADVTSLIGLIQQTQELALEIRCATADPQQEGPARIVSVSSSPQQRNFTLGQEYQDLIFRLRTPAAGLNGYGKYEPYWRNVFADTAMKHIVITVHAGIVTLYVDGEQYGDAIYLYSPRVLVGIPYAFGDWLLVAFAMPVVGLLLAAGQPDWRFNKLALVAVLMGVLPWAVAWMACAWVMGRPTPVGLFAFAAAAAPAGATIGRRLGIRSSP